VGLRAGLRQHDLLAQGLLNTLKVTSASLACGLVLGLGFA
jgi:ABC-type amino acid transport system permease subunit